MTEFLQRVQSVIWNRKFFEVDVGDLFAVGPSQLTEGDVCLHLVPLRRSGRTSSRTRVNRRRGRI
jgi:hypothetical protein